MPQFTQRKMEIFRKLIANAPDMYIALKKCVEFIKDIVCRECYDPTYDAEDMRIYIENILTRVDCPENDKEE